LWLERYETREKLGEGAFGVVYLAWDRLLECEVALKLPKRPRVTSEKDALDFLFEARILARLKHPGIVPFHDVGRAQDGRCYVVSEYIKGEDLRQRLKRRGRLGPREAAELVRQVASALHYAHAEGLVHRDIKPANILFSLSGPEGNAYVADFGLALKTEDVQLASRVAGTPAYMSPEQITGDVSQFGVRSDIFSLGVVFYELLVGECPFRSKSFVDLRREIRSITPKSPDYRLGRAAGALGLICMKCLAKRPADRFQTGKQLADDLNWWLTLEKEGPGTSMGEATGCLCILIAVFAGLVACLSLLLVTDGSILGIVSGIVAWLGIYALTSRMRDKESLERSFDQKLNRMILDRWGREGVAPPIRLRPWGAMP
jgi:serine/threonine protein kinase